jgi:hypothetical protein
LTNLALYIFRKNVYNILYGYVVVAIYLKLFAEVLRVLNGVNQYPRTDEGLPTHPIKDFYLLNNMKNKKEEIHYCKCGCGTVVNRTWARGHSSKGKIFTEEHRKNLSESHKGLLAGSKNPMYGKHRNKKIKELLSKLHTGNKYCIDFKCDFNKAKEEIVER